MSPKEVAMRYRSYILNILLMKLLKLKTGEEYNSVKGVQINQDMKVIDKATQWHYTNEH